MNTPTECCSQFDPAPWQERELEWKDKRFVKDRVRSFLHIPLNFGAVMMRNMAAIHKTGAAVPDMVVLSDENSPWGADLYLEVAKDVPGAEIVLLSGTFLAQAYEGPYRDIPKWVGDLQQRISRRGKVLRKLYFFYTTCPKCAKKFGKNYVVLFGQV